MAYATDDGHARVDVNIAAARVSVAAIQTGEALLRSSVNAGVLAIQIDYLD